MTNRIPLKLKKMTRPGPQPESQQNKWRVLIADDDQEVHAVTRMILSRIRFKGRGIELLAAYSAEEAISIMMREKGIALILLDVVMESDDAGFEVVRFIREDLGNKATRVVLRTGQPGLAPEEQVIVDYDINDYKAKSELTSQKLFTAVITALRSYETIASIERNREGLERIVESTGTLFQIRSVQEFAAGVLTQVASFLQCKPRGIICAQFADEGGGHPGKLNTDLRILAATDEFGSINGLADADGLPADTEKMIRLALSEQRSVIADDCTALYLDARASRAAVVLMSGSGGQMVEESDLRLLHVFASKISIALANALTYQKMVSAEEAATTDFLTGLNNKRQFLRLAQPMLAGAVRQRTPVSVAMLDIDFFKRINDTWGHDAGDAVLKEVGELIKNRFRKSDIVARFGGEEFCVIALGADADGLLEIFDGFRKTVETHFFRYGSERLPVTISCGVCTSVDPDIDVMMKAADAMLYRAKREGRNRVLIDAA